MIAASGSQSPWWISATQSTPNSAPEVAPFPAGLNDCVSGLKWVHANTALLGMIRHVSSLRAKAVAVTSPSQWE